MQGILLIIVLATIVEGLVQYGKTVIDAFSNGAKKTAITQLIAMIIAIALCFTTGADLFAALGIAFNWPTVGIVLTGIFCSRGANYLSDFIKKIQSISGKN